MKAMGPRFAVAKAFRKKYKYSGLIKSDTSILVHNDSLSDHSNTRPEDIGFILRNTQETTANVPHSINSPLAYHHHDNHIFYGRGCLPLDNLRSPSQCTTISSISTVTATPLDTKHRYHLFFAFHPSDKEWVENTVRTLEDEPYNYQCCIEERDFNKDVPTVQNVMCSVMLSQKTVVVTSPQFLEHSWSEYEDILNHVIAISQRRHKLLPLLLHQCDMMPESLKAWSPIDVNTEDFWDIFLQALQLDALSLNMSDSVFSFKTLHTSHSGYQNGQVLVKLSACVSGWCRCSLLFDTSEVPDSLTSYEVKLSHQEYTDVVSTVGREDIGEHLPWVFSILPNLILAVVFLFWCAAFIMVIYLYPDNRKSTLPVRLCVFTLPAICLVLGCFLRWKTLKKHKEKYSMYMFSRSIYMNAILANRGKPVIVSSAKTSDDTFHIYFMYFNSLECEEQVKLCLTHCTDEELKKISKLVDVYTLSNTYLKEKALASRLVIMMSSAYAINIIFKNIPHSLERRHSKKYQCLCQFVEEFLAAYIPCISQEANLLNLTLIFSKYLNCDLKPDPVVLNSLGINIIEA